MNKNKPVSLFWAYFYFSIKHRKSWVMSSSWGNQTCPSWSRLGWRRTVITWQRLCLLLLGNAEGHRVKEKPRSGDQAEVHSNPQPTTHGLWELWQWAEPYEAHLPHVKWQITIPTSKACQEDLLRETGTINSKLTTNANPLSPPRSSPASRTFHCCQPPASLPFFHTCSYAF